ncbi:MAG: hypothetical protein AB7T05_06185, partial [Fimbriimonadaceae bacterium]
IVDFPEKFSTGFPDGTILVVASMSGKTIEFSTRVRIDTPMEREYFLHGGVLHFVLRQLLKS